MLIEVNGESGGQCNLVMGLGLNVYQGDAEKSDIHADYQWIDMHQLGNEPDRNKLVADCVSAWVHMLREFSQTGFATFVDEWNALSSYHGRQIRVQSKKEAVIGRMMGVDDYGALLVQTENGQHIRFTETDVSVRLL